ncbi:ankyrin repeat domain-containing protein 63 [Tiliqua scincoides]|uniref:ankyrin repeat domain-containing protein 63 n=1 Tax=Tiliqua scincoides TaxID=71010 RepID=UPI0034624E06
MLRPRDLGPEGAARTLREALGAGRLDLARFVLEALGGEVADSRAERGRTPLMAAVLLKDPAWRLAFARLLLEHRAAVDLRDDAGRSALSLACERGHLEAVQLLVQFGADPDAADARGWSPLMHAAAAGRAAVLEWLLRAFRRLGQLRLERADRAGRTALQLAAGGGHGQCVRLLRAAGALLLALPGPPPPALEGAAALVAPALHGVRVEGWGVRGRSLESQGGPAEEQPRKSPAAPRGRPLVRRATAPDYESLVDC